jgi:SRSO17 transposase/predicted nucleic acid-binding protein
METTTKVFVDSTVLMAACISASGASRVIVEHGQAGPFSLLASPLVLEETSRNLQKKKPAALTQLSRFHLTSSANPALATIERASRIVALKDAPIIAAAVEGGAEYLVTLDQVHLLSARQAVARDFGLAVLTPGELLAILRIRYPRLTTSTTLLVSVLYWGMKSLPLPKASPVPLPELATYLAPFALLFHRSQSRESLERYVTGLLTDLTHKTCDTIAAAVAGTSTERLQHLLTDADWDPLVLDRLRVHQLVAASPSAGVLVLDDTAFPKRGKHSVGVQPQYCGTLGKIANCQVVVSAEYVADAPTSQRPLHWPVSAQLFLPETWTNDLARRGDAHVPTDQAFATKPQLALGLVDRAREWGVTFGVVVADAGYGDNPTFLAGLEARAVAYVCRVERSFGVRLPEEVRDAAAVVPEKPRGMGRPKLPRPAPLHTVTAVVAAQPEQDWTTIAWREGTKGTLRKQFLAVRVQRATGAPDWGGQGRSTTHGRVTTGPEGWLLGERPMPGEDGEHKYYYTSLPANLPLERLATLAHARWAIEQFYEEAKGECGLADYQGRHWQGLQRHLALTMLTYSFLVLQRQTAPSPAMGAGGFSPLRPSAQLPSRPSPGAGLALPGAGALAGRHRPGQDLSTPT